MGIKNIIGELQVNGKKVLTEGAGGGKLYKHRVNLFYSGQEVEVDVIFTFYTYSSEQINAQELIDELITSTVNGVIDPTVSGECYPVTHIYADSSEITIYYSKDANIFGKGVDIQDFVSADTVSEYIITEVT